MKHQAEHILADNKIRVTPVRLKVLEVFLGHKTAISHSMLEEKLSGTDRVTLYRTLKSFEENGIIHKAVDGTNSARYALCHVDCSHHQHVDNHAHFHCEICDSTNCIQEIEVPDVQLPEGFTSSSTHLIIKGICKNCNS